MKQFNLNGTGLGKVFVRNQYIFKDIDIELQNNNIIGITGANGSGKSTLLKILARTVHPSKGSISLNIENKEIDVEEVNSHFGYVSPYLMLYEEFTPLEHLSLTANMRGIKFDTDFAENYLRLFKLDKKKNEEIKTFSSGMKQRVKFILALQHSPEMLFLDEPTTNLDEEGIEVIKNIVFEQQLRGGAIIIASNDAREKAWCSSFINLV